MRKSKHSDFQRPCRGLKPSRAFAFAIQSYIWLVQTYKEYFIRVALGQIVANHDREAFGKNVFSKDGLQKISRDPVVRFCWEASKMEISVFRFGWCKREVWENFSRREWPRLRSGVMILSLEFWFARSTFFLLLRSGPVWPKFRITYMKIEAFLIWAALPGAQPWKEIILYI